MPVEYKTIRVPPAVYDLALQLREKLRLRSIASLHEFAQDSAKITLGEVIRASLLLLERESERKPEKKTEPEKGDADGR